MVIFPLSHYFKVKQTNMITLDKLVFNSFQVNTYILHDETGECVIIDPSCYSTEENNSLVNHISKKNLTPVLHLNTHCHIDHILGMHFVRKHYKIPSYAHELEQEILENGPLMGDLYGFFIDPFPPLDKHISNGEIISFGNSEIRAIHVPGHSRGSMAYYSEKDAFVITGDALFAGSIGRTDLPGGDYNTLISSIQNNLLSLPGETSVWPGHGASSSIREEITDNPFFRN